MVDRDRLIDALMFRNEDRETSDFAWSQELDGEILNSMQIAGVGDIKIPISIEDVERLKSISEPAPYGKGLNVVVDTSIKKAWEINASKMLVASPDCFFNSTLLEFSANSLRHLQLGWLLENADDNNMPIGVKVRKLVLYETGGHYKRLQESDYGDQGVCCVLVVQIPVENGYRGGLLKIHPQRSSKTKQFEFQKESDRLFYLTAFHSNCEHELEPIQSGWRVTLVINLVWQNAIITKIPLPLPDILDLVTEIRKSLDCWFTCQNQAQHNHQADRGSSDDRLAITGNVTDLEGPSQPLLAGNYEAVSTEYNSNPLVITDVIQKFLHKPNPQLNVDEFAPLGQHDGELGNDCPLYFQVVASCTEKTRNSLPDMLVFLLEHEYPVGDLSLLGLKGQDLLLSRLLLCGNFLDVHLAIMMRQIPETVTDPVNYIAQIKHWINPNTPIKGIHVDIHTQLVKDFQAISRLKSQDVQKEATEKDELSPQEAVLIIWPRHRTFRISCLYAFDSLLDQIESQLHACNHQKIRDTLRRIISFCREDPMTVFGDPTVIPGERTSRLFRLCISLSARDEGLDLLNLIGTDFAKEGSFEKVFYEGVRSDIVAQHIAEFECRTSGWTACSKLILRLITPKRLPSQLNFLISLAHYLKKSNCLEGALKILDGVASYLHTLDASSISSPGQAGIDSFILFAIESEADPKTANSQRIASFTKLFPRLDPYQQCRLVVDLRRQIWFGGVASCMQLYQNMCRALPSCDLHASGPIKTVIVAVVSSFFQLSDPELVNLLLKKICTGTRNQDNELIDVLMSSNEIWKLVASSDLGKTMCRCLIEAQIASVEDIMGQPVTLSPERDTEEPKDCEFLIRDFTKKFLLLENLSQLELQSERNDPIRDARITLIATWINGLCRLVNLGIIDDPADPFQANITCFLRTFIKTEKSQCARNNAAIVIDFSHFFSKLPTRRLCQLILDLYKMEFFTDSKNIPSCLNLFQVLCRSFVARDFIPSVTLVVVKVAKCMLWLGDHQSLEVFTQKICNSVSLNKENILVKKVVTSSSVWPLAISSPSSLKTFYVLLDRRIDYLKELEVPVFSLAFPEAHLEKYPEVETFLRSAEETMDYHNLSSMFHARTFADTVAKLCLENGWCSLKIQILGSARKAWCEITKTQSLHQMRLLRFEQNQRDLSDMLALRQDFEFKATKSSNNLKRLVSLPIGGTKKDPIVIDILSD